MTLPVIAITMGDPAGIGPELIVKILSDEALYARCRPLVIGDIGVMQQIARTIDANMDFTQVQNVSDATFRPGIVAVLPPDGLSLSDVVWGTIDAAYGDAAARCIKTGLELGQQGAIDGMVLAPMNKEAFHLAGYDYLDELAYMSDITGSEDAYIAGLVGNLWTVAVSEHIPFSAIRDYVKRDRILRYIQRLQRLLESVGRPEPAIGVAALNPHGGEGGLFGRDEIDEILPAVKLAQQDDIDARGPLPADTIFLTARAESFDAILCMYHDQANIARKLVATWDGATVYMGLPIPCSTTAHGTAFDKAGRGVSDPGSLRSALATVIALASAA